MSSLTYIDLRIACEGFENPILAQVVNSVSRNTIGYDSLSYNSLGNQVVEGCLQLLLPIEFKPISFLYYICTKLLWPEGHARIIDGMVDIFESKYRDVKIPIIGSEIAGIPVTYKDACITVVGVLTAVIEQKDVEKLK